MPIPIDRHTLQRLLLEGAQLIEVLPAQEYNAGRLPGASNIPLSTLDRHSVAQLQRDRSVIVYCYDSQ